MLSSGQAKISHPVTLDLLHPYPAVLRSRQPINLFVRARGPRGEDLLDAAIEIKCESEVLAEGYVSFPPKIIDQDDLPPDQRHEAISHAFTQFSLNAPAEVGAYEWRICFPAQTCRGVDFLAADIFLAFEVIAQTTSLAVWDLPFPAIVGQAFKLKVGARSLDSFSLSGAKVELLMHGRVIGDGILSSEPWPGSAALHWTEIEAKAPTKQGVAHLTARLSDITSCVPHRGCMAAFSFPVSQAPETQLTVVVTDRSGHPVIDAEVRPDCFSGKTNSDGEAIVDVPLGQIEIAVTRLGYDFWVGACDTRSQKKIIIELDAEQSDEDPIWI